MVSHLEYNPMTGLTVLNGAGGLYPSAEHPSTPPVPECFDQLRNPKAGSGKALSYLLISSPRKKTPGFRSTGDSRYKSSTLFGRKELRTDPFNPILAAALGKPPVRFPLVVCIGGLNFNPWILS